MSAVIEGWVEYDYAIVRLVPQVHLDAFQNVGVVLHSRQKRFLDVRFALDSDRIARLWPTLDLTLVERYLTAYRAVCLGGFGGGPIGLLPPSERFHWLTAPRSAVVQTSAVHPGRCRTAPEIALDNLLQLYC